MKSTPVKLVRVDDRILPPGSIHDEKGTEKERNTDGCERSPNVTANSQLDDSAHMMFSAKEVL